MKRIVVFFLVICSSTLWSQDQNKISDFKAGFQQFLADSDFSHAMIGLEVYDLQSGTILIDHNAEVGLQAASNQKVITAATSFALLGKDFKYQTQIGYSGKITDGTLYGNLIVKGSGDPTLGSFRYAKTTEKVLIKTITEALRKQGINRLKGHVIVDESVFEGEVIPDGWIWQDLGNYYGAGAHGLNWRENQYDLYLKPGNQIGDPATIVKTVPKVIPDLHIVSDLKTAARGTGDRSFIYYPDFGRTAYIRGTIPAGQQSFPVKGSVPNPARLFALTLEAAINQKDPSQMNLPDGTVKNNAADVKWILSLPSPSLDSISYWFLNQSINLYGEALLKTLGNRFGNGGATGKGLKVIKKFWKKQGIDSFSLGMMDGSGLSPENRITPSALVDVLLYTRKQPWFNAYYAGFPIIHGIHMKSGTISGTVAYTGFISGPQGNYVFSVIVNNHKGSVVQTREKIWKLLDLLK